MVRCRFGADSQGVITMTNEDLSEISELATYLLRQRGIDLLAKIEPVTGGRNNRAFRVNGQNSSWLLKLYFRDRQGRRNRCGSEWEWSQFCWQRGVTWGPEPLARDEKNLATLFEFIEGRHLRKDEVADAHVVQAAQFVAEVNLHRSHPLARNLPDAAEACDSYKDHVACVDRRINRLSSLPVTDECNTQLHDWLRSSLEPAWELIVKQLRSSVDPEQYQTPILRSGH